MGTGGGLTVIDFSERGNSAHFRGDGWSGQEPAQVWGIGPRSVLRVPLQSSGRPAILEAEIGPCHAPPEIVGQIVHVRVNGVAIGSVRLEALSVLRCEIDPGLTRADGILEIEFECPGFYVPAWAGVAGDRRPLSCWFNFVRVYTTDMFSPGPQFPASHPDIPTIGLTTAYVAMSEANARTPAEVYSFCRTEPLSESDEPQADDNEFSVLEGSSGQLKLLAPRTPGAYVLRVDACPLIASDPPVNHIVTIVLDGFVIGQISVAEPSAWALPLPRELTEKRDILRLNFMLPGPAGAERSDTSPRDGISVTRIAILPVPSCLARAVLLRGEQAGPPQPTAVSQRFLTEPAPDLPAAIEAALGMDIPTLARRFESLGIGPAFGMVQQQLGLEVLNLFRFCETTLEGLTQALTDDLRAAANPDLLTVQPDQSLALPPYNLRWQSFVANAATDRETWRHGNAVTLGYLRRKFYQGLRAGQKIYVLHRPRSIPMAQAAVLLFELKRCGAPTILCIEQATNRRQPGEVELLLPGLMRGYIGQLPSGGPADPADWLRVLGNAALLHREPQACAAT